VSAQLPLFEPESDWTPPQMSELPEWSGVSRIGLDTETRDEHLTTLGPGVRRGGYIAGISFALEDGPAHYLPIAHGGGGNMDPDAVLRYMRAQAASYEGIIVGANLGYDLDYLAEVGVEFPRVKFFRDVQIADPLINELHNKYSLEAISQRWGIPGKDETLLREALAAYGYKGNRAKAGIWALPSKHVGPYAEQDARLPLSLLRRQEGAIDEQNLWGVYDLESRVLPVLVRMRRRGVAVSVDRLDQVEAWTREQQQLAMNEVNRHHTQHPLQPADITKTATIGKVLRSLGVDLPVTKTGKDSVTAAVLDGLDHPIGEALRRAKKMSTLRTTFCDGVRKHLTNGRIHCTFNQMRRQKDDGSGDTEGAAYGRLSAANPNLQNQPARDPEIGPMWRSIYLPDEGGLWASLDYSQQEPRQAVHFAVEAGAALIGEKAWQSACEAARRYKEDPTTDFHQMMADMAHIERKPAKNIFLGLSYGMGGAKLCRDLGLPTVWRMQWSEGRRRQYKDFETQEECLRRAQKGREAGYKVRVWEAAGPDGEALMNKFDYEVPFVRRMAQSTAEAAERTGVVTTLSGRQCHFPKKQDGSWDWTHKAFNRLIQGSSADQTKEAVVAMDAAGYPLQLQVHDEVDMTVPSREYAEEAAVMMENVVSLHVPSKVDVEVGPSWGEAA